MKRITFGLSDDEFFRILELKGEKSWREVLVEERLAFEHRRKAAYKRMAEEYEKFEGEQAEWQKKIEGELSI